jgi:succinylarginine dihydrolase
VRPGHGEPGVEVFVYGVAGGPYPARQHVEASRAVARLHRLDPARVILAAQSEEAIAAGAFHNDVVAVGNGPVLFAHERAFADRDALLGQLSAAVPGFDHVEVAEAEVPLADAIASYLFNAQLVSVPGGGMTLVAPTECREVPSVRAWIERHLASNGAIRAVDFVDVRQSMANGGGPACLRLRVVCDPASVDPRFLADEARLDRLAEVVERHWPAAIAPGDLADPALVAAVEAARAALLDALGLSRDL